MSVNFDETIMASIIKQINKDYGKGSIFSLDEESVNREYEVISTGSIGLDNAVGNGGLVKGRIIEVYGSESSGKTTLLLNIMKNALANDPRNVYFVDVEHSLDLRYVRNVIGDDYKRILLSQPDCAEEALSMIAKSAEGGTCSMIALDSVAGLAPRAEIEGNIEDATIAVIARLMSKSLRILKGLADKNNILIVYSNQMRDTIGFAPTTPGGRALKYYTSTRIELRAKKKEEHVVSVLAKVQKNKCAVPYKSCIVPIAYGEGISRAHELIQYCSDFGLLKKSGTWYSYDGQQIGQGVQSVIAFFKEHPEVMTKLESSVKEIFLADE